jgi:hypothetical protein
MGIKGKSNFKDRTLILATSYLLVAATTLPLKNITHVQRPDGSSANSFHPVIQQRHLLAQSFFGKNIKMFQFGTEFQDMS